MSVPAVVSGPPVVGPAVNKTARIQSLTVEQGPAQRRRGVATVKLLSTVGPVSPVVAHLDEPEAVRLLAEQVVRSGHARQRAQLR